MTYAIGVLLGICIAVIGNRLLRRKNDWLNERKQRITETEKILDKTKKAIRDLQDKQAYQRPTASSSEYYWHINRPQETMLTRLDREYAERIEFLRRWNAKEFGHPLQ